MPAPYHLPFRLILLGIVCIPERRNMKPVSNPVIYSDFPDIDIVRVEDTYYMVSTTMYFMPGGDLLRSYDLLHWEFVGHIFDSLEDNDAHRLVGGANIYSQGMWAPSFRYHKGRFYLVFSANDCKKTYLFTTENPKGPWERRYIAGFFHDSSLFFDDDDRVYLVHGNRTIRITELSSDLSGAKEGGLDRVLMVDSDDFMLGFEGSHLYKINGLYYLFNIHWPRENSKRRAEVVQISDSLTGEFVCHTIIDDNMGFHNQGIAQGGIVDTPNGDWYAFMFRDSGAVGRCPVVLPMRFENNIPVVGIPLDKVREEERQEHQADAYRCNDYLPRSLTISSTRPDYVYAPLNGDDDFSYTPEADGSMKLKPFWQFNHRPDFNMISFTERKRAYRIRTDVLSPSFILAKNTLTQRMMAPQSSATVTVDASQINNGDYAAFAALQGTYGLVAVTKRENQYFLVMQGYVQGFENGRPVKDFSKAPEEYACIPLSSPIVRLKIEVDFTDMTDKASFFYAPAGTEDFTRIGVTHQLYFRLDHFTGCRFAMGYFSTEAPGGCADFMEFRYLQ